MTISTFGPAGPDRPDELAAVGATIAIEIGGFGANAPTVRAQGLIDTGASVVCIGARIARKLGLPMSDQRMVSMVSGEKVLSTVYTGVLTVPELQFSELMPLYSVEAKYDTHEVLLGREFLRHFIVTFNGPEGMFHFASPRALRPDPMDDYAS